jgi:hypothetical protein
MKKTLAVISVAVSLMAFGAVCQGNELVIKGTQIKGNAGRNAEIISKTVKLTTPAKITKIEGAPEGLCIESPAEQPLCGSTADLIGRTLKPGSYTTYPNIPTNKERQSVTIHLKSAK